MFAFRQPQRLPGFQAVPQMPQAAAPSGQAAGTGGSFTMDDIRKLLGHGAPPATVPGSDIGSVAMPGATPPAIAGASGTGFDMSDLMSTLASMFG
jgi:hypothetical protein